MKLVGKRKGVRPVDADKLKAVLKEKDLGSLAKLSREIGYNSNYFYQYLNGTGGLPMVVLNYLDKVYGITLDDIKPDPIPEPEPEPEPAPEPEPEKESHKIFPEEWEKQIYRATLNGTYKGIIKAVKQLKEDGIL